MLAFHPLSGHSELVRFVAMLGAAVALVPMAAGD